MREKLKEYMSRLQVYSARKHAGTPVYHQAISSPDYALLNVSFLVSSISLTTAELKSSGLSK